jgi:hypothetical protein
MDIIVQDGFHQSIIHLIFRDTDPGHHHGSRPPDIAGHTCTRGRMKVRLNGVLRGTPGIEKVNGKNRDVKGMNPNSA